MSIHVVIQAGRFRCVTSAIFAVVVTVDTSSPALAARFEGQAIAVVRSGREGVTLSDSSNAVSVLEFGRTGTGQSPKQTILIPNFRNTNVGGLSLNGVTQAEGHLTLSSDGEFLSLGGYDMVIPTSPATNHSSTTYNRSVASVSVATGAVTINPRLGDAFHNGSLRSVVSNGTQFWTAGSGTSTLGVRYVANSSATTSIYVNSSHDRTASRFASIVNGRLFVSTQTSIQTFETALPTSTDVKASNLSMTTAPSEAHAFFFVDRSSTISATGMAGLDTLYIAEGSGGRSIRKYEWTGSTWTARGLAYGANVGPNLFGLIGKAAADGTVQMYATAMIGSNNGLYSFVDSSAFGSNIHVGTSQTLLAQAGTNYAFRGIAFVPEPAGMVGVAGIVSVLLTRRYRRRTR